MLIIKRVKDQIKKKRLSNPLKKNIRPSWLTTNLLFYQASGFLIKILKKPDTIIATDG